MVEHSEHGAEACHVCALREIERLRAEVAKYTAPQVDATWIKSDEYRTLLAHSIDRDRLRAAIQTAQRRFELIASGVSRETADPAVGARECAEALAGAEQKPNANMEARMDAGLAELRQMIDAGEVEWKRDAEPASESRPVCRRCGSFVDSRGKCRISEHNA